MRQGVPASLEHRLGLVLKVDLLTSFNPCINGVSIEFVHLGFGSVMPVPEPLIVFVWLYKYYLKIISLRTYYISTDANIGGHRFVIGPRGRPHQYEDSSIRTFSI